MAHTIRATQIHEALKRAKKVGLIEESVTIAGCPLVIRNLSPEEFPAIVQELEEVPEEEYLFQFQLQNVCRSIVEIDGQDLRDVDFIEEEVPSGAYILAIQLGSEDAARKLQRKLKDDLKVKSVLMPPQGDEERTVQVPRHEWLLKNVVRNWGYEALVVAWRKATEIRIQADEAAKKGVTFQVPDETAEDKVRRLLIDLQEASGDLPDDMLDRILGEADLLRKASSEELSAANQKLAELASVAAPVTKAQPASPEPVQQPRRRSIAEIAAMSEDDDEEEQAPAPKPQARTRPVARQEAQEPTEVVRNRQPLNEQFANAPAPTPPPPPAPAQRRPAVPDHIRQAALANTVGVNASMAEEGIMLRGRAAETAALESALDPIYSQPNMIMSSALPNVMGEETAEVPQDSLELSPAIDPKALMGIVNRPPAVGLNSRFTRTGRPNGR